MSGASFLLFLLLLASAPAEAQRASKKGQSQRPPDSPEASQAQDLGQAVLGPAIAAERISDPGRQSDWPAIAYGNDGTLYALYIEWNDKDADRVVVKRRTPRGEWLEPVALEDGAWDHYSPAIAATPQGALAVWAGQRDGDFELYSVEISAQGKPALPRRLTTAPHSDFNAALVSNGRGDAVLAWQTFRHGNSDVYAQWWRNGRWGAPVRVSTSSASDWEPSVALAGDGTAWIAWDTYQHGNYDVMLRSWDGKALGPVIAMTTEPAAQFHSTVAVDAQGRVWVAWDDGGENWGKDFSRSSAAPGSRGLHYARTLGLRVFANSRIYEPQADLGRALTGRMTRYAELPHLAFDASGTLWMVFRHWTAARPHEIYHFYATRLEGSQWTAPRLLMESSGHNSQKTWLARRPEGTLVAAYSSDGRSATNAPRDQQHALHYVVWKAELEKGSAAAAVAFRDVTLPAPGSPAPRRPRHTMTAGGRTYTLLFGDCHRHTDIRGHSGVDGSVLDTYRYAIDAAQLDFLGTSDHNEVNGGRWPDGLRDYQWWWTQKAVDLFTHAPHFIGVYSYEHSMARPAGHRNVLFLKRGAPLRAIDRESRAPDAQDNLPPALWKFWEEKVLSQPGQKSVIVPHTFAAGPLADWNWPNARFDCLLEIYQGCRGSYEAYKLPNGEKRGPTQVDEGGHYAQDALARGNTYGFVSFSDHGSTHNSWAGVWVLRQDREGLLDGMYERRTFGSSDEIILKVAADGRMVGQEWQAVVGRAPLIEAHVEAPDTILRIDVVKDGKYVYTTRPNSRTAKLSWRDNDTRAGRSYYYVRVFQRDPEAPEGEPEIAWSSPFYVTYR